MRLCKTCGSVLLVYSTQAGSTKTPILDKGDWSYAWSVLSLLVLNQASLIFSFCLDLYQLCENMRRSVFTCSILGNILYVVFCQKRGEPRLALESIALKLCKYTWIIPSCHLQMRKPVEWDVLINMSSRELCPRYQQ